MGLLANHLNWLFLFVLELPVLGSLQQLANHFKVFVLTCFRWLETLRLLRAMKPRSKEAPWKFTPNTFSILICQGYFPLCHLLNTFCVSVMRIDRGVPVAGHSFDVFDVWGVASQSGFDFEDPKHVTQVLNPTSCQGPFPNAHFYMNLTATNPPSFFWISCGGPLHGHIFPFMGTSSPSWSHLRGLGLIWWKPGVARDVARYC